MPTTPTTTKSKLIDQLKIDVFMEVSTINAENERIKEKCEKPKN